MRILRLKLTTGFRGLQKGFEINFRQPIKSKYAIEPVCLVGLNGSGKSNVMEAIAEVFFYLEAIHHEFANKYIRETSPFGFEIQYTQPVTWQNVLPLDQDRNWLELGHRQVVISKAANEIPKFEYFYEDFPEPLSLKKGEETQKLLPANVIGYSSGMNELISNPFLKMEYFYFDDFESRRKGKAFGNIDMNRMFFMDYESNKSVILSNYLIHDADENIVGELGPSYHALNILNDIIRVKDLLSFKISINYPLEEKNRKQIELPAEIRQIIDQLENCSTTIDEILDPTIGRAKAEFETEIEYQKRIRKRVDFYFDLYPNSHDHAVKSAFKDQFGTSHELFRRLHTLNLLNTFKHHADLRESVKTAGLGTNISDLIPKLPVKDRIFSIDQITFIDTNGRKVRYKQLSDGEHQYLHVVGTLMLMDHPGTLFLLDEPETHFNPEWRSKLISTLNDVINTQQGNQNSDVDTIPRDQQIILTTHSPFIISNCQPENVNIMFRDLETKDVISRAPEINTFGASSEVLLKSIFNKRASIPELPLKKIDELKNLLSGPKPDFEKILDEISSLGESVEKFMLQDYLYRVQENKRDA